MAIMLQKSAPFTLYFNIASMVMPKVCQKVSWTDIKFDPG